MLKRMETIFKPAYDYIIIGAGSAGGDAGAARASRKTPTFPCCCSKAGLPDYRFDFLPNARRAGHAQEPFMPHQGARIHVDNDIGAGEFGGISASGLIGQIMRLDRRQRIIQLQMQLNERNRPRLASPQIMDAVHSGHRDGQRLDQRTLLVGQLSIQQRLHRLIADLLPPLRMKSPSRVANRPSAASRTGAAQRQQHAGI